MDQLCCFDWQKSEYKSATEKTAMNSFNMIYKTFETALLQKIV